MKKSLLFLLITIILILLAACTKAQNEQDLGIVVSKSGEHISSNELAIVITDNAGLKMKEELNNPDNTQKIHRVEFSYSGSG